VLAVTAAAGGCAGAPPEGVQRNQLRHRRKGDAPQDDKGDDVVCVEALEGGRRRVYRLRCGYEGGRHWHGFDMVEDEQTHQGRAKELVKSYLLPQVRVGEGRDERLG
jgi:hypothetical protein